MTIEVLGGDIHLVDLETRLPFRYGIATMTEAPHAFVRFTSWLTADPLPASLPTPCRQNGSRNFPRRHWRPKLTRC
ncbi:MAG: hypothetical protein Ct9H300mP1_14610 [Planctomycetaceae bacterium]|nr:MAG: hypothetical protein Ct9H300mP1_14610 [Planctomycetaceae bacterium]